MDRRRAVYTVVGLLAVLAVALAASALSDPIATSGGGAAGPGRAAGGDWLPVDPPTVEFVSSLELLAMLLWLLAGVAIVAIIRNPLHSLVQFLQTLVAVAVLGGFVWLLLLLFAGGPGDAPFADAADNSTGGGFGGADAGSVGVPDQVAETLPPIGSESALLLVLLVGTLLLGGLVLGMRDGTDRLGETEEEADDALAAIGRSAGRAADRLAADATVDNEVYRAWKEMTDHLELANPDVRTPAEFRAAAVEAGMAERDVDVLTDLFEHVRYGGASASAEREDRARSALRRIERRYAEER